MAWQLTQHIQGADVHIRSSLLLIGTVVAVQSAGAASLTIDTINISTVFGYGDTHYPVPYPSYDRFSILGAAFSYTLSDGQVRTSGAGWIPYTNGKLSAVSLNGNSISYEFDKVNNWARGDGTIFYSVGQVWCPACQESGSGLWTEGQFVPVSPIVLTAQLGSATAMLTGTARIQSNNAASQWGLPENFLAFSAGEGAVVNYSAMYTLTDGSTWDQGVFGRQFTYNMTGTINVAAVPETSTAAVLAVGLGLMAVLGIRRKKVKAVDPTIVS